MLFFPFVTGSRAYLRPTIITFLIPLLPYVILSKHMFCVPKKKLECYEQHDALVSFTIEMKEEDLPVISIVGKSNETRYGKSRFRAIVCHPGFKQPSDPPPLFAVHAARETTEIFLGLGSRQTSFSTRQTFALKRIRGLEFVTRKRDLPHHFGHCSFEPVPERRAGRNRKNHTTYCRLTLLCRR